MSMNGVWNRIVQIVEFLEVGDYDDSTGSNLPASVRNHYSTTLSGADLGFRVAFYINKS